MLMRLLISIVAFCLSGTAGSSDSTGLRNWMAHLSADEQGSQTFVFVRDQIDTLGSPVSKGRADVLSFIRDNSMGGNLWPHITDDELPDFLNNANFTWFGDVNDDGKDDLVVEFGEGSANCIHVDVVISAGTDYRRHRLPELMSEPGNPMQFCSGAGHLGGVRNVNWNSGTLLLAYSLTEQTGHMRLVNFDGQGQWATFEDVEFKFETKAYEQSLNHQGQPYCPQQICDAALKKALPHLQAMFSREEQEPVAYSSLVKKFVASFAASEEAADLPVHPWGRYSEYSAAFSEFSYEGESLVLKVAPAGIGWREWCCGVSVYAAASDTFVPIAHMFVNPIKQIRF